MSDPEYLPMSDPEYSNPEYSPMSDTDDQPHPGNEYEPNDRHSQDIVSAFLKKTLSEWMSRPESEVLTYNKENCDDGRIKVTVTFKTDGEV